MNTDNFSKDHSNQNYYEILEVPYNSKQDEIYEGYVRAKNAYSGESAALYSLMSKEECKEMLDLIETAYSVLSVPDKKREYDKIKGLIPKENNTFTQIPEPTRSIQMEYLHQGATSSFQLNHQDGPLTRLTASKKFQLLFERDEEFEEKIEKETDYCGDFLKKIREYKNVTIERMSELTKISKTYIKFIEQEKIDHLPALAYVRGFVYQYAKILKLNPNLVATSYLNYIKSKENA